MLIHKNDNVSIDLNNGHKYAICAIPKGENVILYASPIGHAIRDIMEGELVHSHNMATNWAEDSAYRYVSGPRPFPGSPSLRTFSGYRRENGTVGIRNDIWILNTEPACRQIAESIGQKSGAMVFSCLKLHEDPMVAQKLFRGIVNHPNAGGVLVLGREDSLESYRKSLGRYDRRRVKFLNCQDIGNEIAAGIYLVNDLRAYAATFQIEQIPLFHLTVGLKCGDSDHYSDLVENPLVGRFSDKLIYRGGSCLLTEVPEMFGAEHLLMERCVNKAVFEKAVAMLSNFKDYCNRIGRPIRKTLTADENSRGITTPEEKAMRHLQKAGIAPVADVLGYGERIRENGLSLVEGTDQDEAAIINLMAAGAHLVLLTAGAAAPLKALIPVICVCGAPEPKDRTVDFDASRAIQREELEDQLFDYVMQVASGLKTANEK